jgi:hypothetical protein
MLFQKWEQKQNELGNCLNTVLMEVNPSLLHWIRQPLQITSSPNSHQVVGFSVTILSWLVSPPRLQCCSTVLDHFCLLNHFTKGTSCVFYGSWNYLKGYGRGDGRQKFSGQEKWQATYECNAFPLSYCIHLLWADVGQNFTRKHEKDIYTQWAIHTT